MYSCISILHLRVIFPLDFNNLSVFILSNSLEKHVEIFTFSSVVYKSGFILLCVSFNNKIYTHVHAIATSLGGDLFNMK